LQDWVKKARGNRAKGERVTGCAKVSLKDGKAKPSPADKKGPGSWS